MKTANRFFVMTLSAAFVCILALMGGCKDDPQKQAAKDARAGLERALETIDVYSLEGGFNYDEARKQLRDAYNAAAKANMQADAVFQAAGDLDKAYATKLANDLSLIESDAPKKLDAAGRDLSDLQYLLVKKDMYSLLNRADKNELENLLAVVNGTDSEPGLAKRLEEKRAELKSIEAEYAKIKEQIAATQAKARKLAIDADNMLRDADMLAGDEKLRLQDAAYNLIRGIGPDGKKVKGRLDYELELQNLIDKSEVIESDMLALAPVVEKMEKDLEEINQRIADLKNGDKDIAVMKYTASIDGQIAEKQDAVKKALAAVREDVQAYSDAAKKVIDTYDTAVKDYHKVAVRDLKYFASLDTAICLNAKAKQLAELSNYYARLGRYAETYSDIATDDLAGMFETMAADMKKSAAESLDMAKKAYADASEKYESTINRSDGEFAARAVRSYLLMIADMINLEKKTGGDQKKIDELIAKVEEFKGIAIENDEYFSKSVVARQFADFGIEFKTKQEKLLESYAELDKLVDDCATIEDSEKKRAAVMNILEQLSRLDTPSDKAVRDNLTEKIYSTLKDQLKEIRKDNPEFEGLSIFNSRLQAEEDAENKPANTEAATNEGVMPGPGM